MKHFIFNHDDKKLPKQTKSIFPVQIFGINDRTSYIGNTIEGVIKRKGVRIPENAMDFLSIAMAVTAADTFFSRSDSDDGWHRQFILDLPLCEPSRWEFVKDRLEKTLYYLSGDAWTFNFTKGGKKPPVPTKHQLSEKWCELNKLNCVSLFSGGLDSAIGVIDLIQEGNKPLLVSHAYRADKSCQNNIKSCLSKEMQHYQFNADPHLRGSGLSDITMRTRSLNFIAFGILSVCILESVTQNNKLELIIPENGFISLNAPLTKRRIGSLSTRTTHPYFIESMSNILHSVGLPCRIRNPYQFKTKGEMVVDCKDKKILSEVYNYSVSCSHWHRRNKQCGVCVPCIIRRAALHAGKIMERDDYFYNDILSLLSNPVKSDDIQSLMLAIKKLNTDNVTSWILKNASLPHKDINKYEKVFRDGLLEVNKYFNSIGIKI